MEQENADVQTVTGVSASPSIGSFGRFGRNLGITIARDAKSLSWNRPSFSSQKKSDRKSRHQEVGEWSLDECRHSIMELAKELNRVLKNTAIPTIESSEEMCSLEDCRCFMKKWADELDKLYPNLKQNRSLGQVERSEGADLRTNEGEEHRLKIAYYIMREWPWKLKTESEGVVSQPLEAPVRKATVLTRGQKQAAAAAPPASTTHRAVPQPALTRAPVTRASKPSAAPVTVKTRTSHRAATAKGQTKETELKKKPVKDPQVPEESRTVPVPKPKSDAVEMGEHVLETCRQTSERETPASVPAEQSSAPVESQQPPSFAPDNYVFQPPAWITAHRLTPMSPCSASAFLVPTFRWSPVQRSKSDSCQPTAVTDFRNEVLRPDCKAHEPSNSTAPPEETPDSKRLDIAPQSPDNYLFSSKSENLAPSPTAESGNSIPDMFSPRKDDQEMVDCPLKEHQDMQTSSRKEDPAFGSSPRKDEQEMTSSPVKNEQAVLGSPRKLGDAPLKVDQEVAGSPRKCDQDMEVSSPSKADYQKMSSPRKDDQEMTSDNFVVFCPHNKDDHTLEETSSKVGQALSCPNKDDRTQDVSPSRESQAGFASSSQQDQSVPAPGGEREARNAASWGTQGQPAEPPHDVPYFRGAIEKETERLTFLSEQWQSRTEEAGIPEEIQDLMRTTVGQARLLMAERFKQFAGLVDDCEFKRGEKETTCTDLEGFWDMVYFQVEDVNKKFTNLTELQESGWQQISHFQPKAKKAVKKAAPPSKAGKAEGLSVTAARSRLAAVKAAMKARKQEAELQRKVAEEEPKQTVPVVVFDAGFFKVESPAKLQPGKRISRCSTAHSCATPLRAVSAEGPDSSRTTGSPLHNVLHTPERPCSPPALNPPCSPDHTQEMNHSAHTRVAAQDVLSRTPNTENEFQVFDFEKYLQPMARLSESPATCLAPLGQRGPPAEPGGRYGDVFSWTSTAGRGDGQPCAPHAARGAGTHPHKYSQHSLSSYTLQ